MFCGQVAQQLLHQPEGGHLVVGGEVGHAAADVVRHRAAQRVEVHILAGHRLDHIRAGDEHKAGLARHNDEIGERRGVDRAAGARPHLHRDLRDHARGHHVAHEQLAVGRQRPHPFLDACAAGVEQADHRDAALLGELHDFADLVRLHLGKGAAEYGEILGVNGDAAAVDLPEAGHHAVAGEFLAGHAEVADVVRGEPAQLLEGAAVQQQVDAFAGRQLAFGVLIGDARLAAAELGLRAHLAQFGELVFSHGGLSLYRRMGGLRIA